MVNRQGVTIIGLVATILVVCVVSVSLAAWVVHDIRHTMWRTEGMDHLMTSMHARLLDLQGCAGSSGQPDFGQCTFIRNGTTGSECTVSNALEPMRQRHERAHEGTRSGGLLPALPSCTLCKKYPADGVSWPLPPDSLDAHFLDRRVCP